ncbi:MAG: hypothetical protein E7266_06740 [Lachnospiraceae bacterium]|nr:hypothetical protein [Lachnospiraceae bacterium]
MMQLLVFKDQLKKIYRQYSMFINPALKFGLTLISLFVINSQIGYYSLLGNIAVMVLISLASILLPVSAIALITSVVIVGNMYGLSLYSAAATLIMFAAMYLIFFRFTPKSGIYLLIVPVLFILKVPFVVPIVAGIVSTPVAIIPMAMGLYLYFFINYAAVNGADLITLSANDPLALIKNIALEPVMDEALWVMIIAFAAVTIAVYIIRRLAIDYPHYIAIAAGGALNIIIVLIGSLKFDMGNHMSVAGILVGGIVSIALAFAVDFFVLTVDYSRTEIVQYEDDDYYYYVKAVPKIKVTAPEVRVKRINARRATGPDEGKK